MRTDQKGRDTMKKQKCTSICMVQAVLLLYAVLRWLPGMYLKFICAVNLLFMSFTKIPYRKIMGQISDHVDPGQKVKEVNIKNEGTVIPLSG